MPSKIEWTDETWNPIVGCTKISPGCDNIDTIEQVKPDPELMSVAERVMDQDDAILRMNGRLLDMLTSPVLLVRGKDSANTKAEG